MTAERQISANSADPDKKCANARADLSTLFADWTSVTFSCAWSYDAQRGKRDLMKIAICKQCRPRSACAFAQSDQGLHCLLKQEYRYPTSIFPSCASCTIYAPVHTCSLRVWYRGQIVLRGLNNQFTNSNPGLLWVVMLQRICIFFVRSYVCRIWKIRL